MRLSKYVSTHPDGRRTLLFNAAGEQIFVLEPELAELMTRHAGQPDALRDVHPTFYEQLCRTQCLVSDDADEAEDLVARWKAQDDDPSHFGITVNPTLACNLRCWYCYEEHRAGTVISDATREAICRLIAARTADERLRSLNVSFFGGEPLLSFRKAVLPILQYAAEACAPRQVRFYSNFTTNGVLLTDEVLEALDALPLAKPATFQITFDGNRNWHDNVRYGANRESTYDVILSHVEAALRRGHEVFVRFNYTFDNILTFLDTLGDFNARHLADYGGLLSVKFEHVWQDGGNQEQVRPYMRQVRDAFKEAGFRVGTDDIHYRHVCYADTPQHLVINYNGDIFKCTARDFVSAQREGVLHDDGSVKLNDVYERRMGVALKARWKPPSRRSAIAA